MNPLDSIQEKVKRDERISTEEARILLESKDLLGLGRIASIRRKAKNGKRAYFIVNRHINHTNICVNRCRFCAFSRNADAPDAYTMDLSEVLARAEAGAAEGASEFHIVGGLHPDLPFDYYLKLLSGLRDRFPKIHIQAFTAVEIDYFTKLTGRPLPEILRNLKEAGLGSLPGGGAEIFDPAVRNAICPEKISGDRWLEVMEAAHNTGLKSNATMLYGHLEDTASRIDHMARLRNLQDRTGGFQAFIPLAFHPGNTAIPDREITTGMEDLKLLAVSRIFLDNFDHIKAFWIMLGEKIAQVSLHFGVDDLDGTVEEEKITHAAGAQTSEALSKEMLVRMIREAGFEPVERDTLYRVSETNGR
ncbi:MAG: aminofutalosine synthase MqnE [Deltaproteobacteria bacterium]|nr:aminofutalosine synthase MqnE [Deltaproteobacteria bacterium]